MTDRFADWMRDLEARHLADLTFAEVSRALRALSSNYVERRGTLAAGGPLAGAGKRAAFALFYGPLHYLLVQNIVSALDAAKGQVSTLVDLGCGTGAAGAAWAAAFDFGASRGGHRPPSVAARRGRAHIPPVRRQGSNTSGRHGQRRVADAGVGLPCGIRAQRVDGCRTSSGVVASFRSVAWSGADRRTAGRFRRAVVAAMERRRVEGRRPVRTSGDSRSSFRPSWPSSIAPPD